MTNTSRIDYPRLAARSFKQLVQLSMDLHKGPLGARLTAMVFLRASQINGCGYCIDMHWHELTRLGMQARHINSVAGWRESPWLEPAERAALAWTEAVTLIPQRQPGEAEFEALRAHFSDEQIAELSFAIGAINAWNRINVSLHQPIPA